MMRARGKRETSRFRTEIRYGACKVTLIAYAEICRITLHSLGFLSVLTYEIQQNSTLITWDAREEHNRACNLIVHQHLRQIGLSLEPSNWKFLESRFVCWLCGISNGINNLSILWNFASTKKNICYFTEIRVYLHSKLWVSRYSIAQLCKRNTSRITYGDW